MGVYFACEILSRLDPAIMPSLDQALPLEDLELALQLITQGFVSMAVRGV